MAIGIREYQRASVLERLEAHRHRDEPAPGLGGRRSEPDCPARGGRTSGPRLPGDRRVAQPAGHTAALPERAAARLPQAADLPRRRRRSDQPGRPGRRLDLVHPRTGGRPAVLRRGERRRSAGRDRARRGARPAVRAVVETSPAGPPPLLRLRLERGHRLLQRGDDAGGGPVRGRAAHQDGDVQLHAAARAAGADRCRAGHRRHDHRGGPGGVADPHPDGRADRRRGGRLLRADPGTGDVVPDRQDPDPRVPRRRGPRTARADPARAARLVVAERQRPDRPAALGTARADRRTRHDRRGGRP